MLKSYRQLSRNTTILSMTVGLVLTANFAWSPLLALHLRDLGANELQVGIAFSVFELMHAFPALLGGMLADRLGRKWVFTAPGFVLTPLYIVAALTRDWFILSVVLAGTSFVGALQWPAMQAFMSESDHAHRALAFSLMEIFVLGAAVVGPLLGSFLLPTLGVSGLIFLHGIALLPATAARSLLLRETHHESQRAALNFQQWRTTIPRAVLWITGANALFALTLGLSFEGPFSALLANEVWRLNEQQIQWVNALSAAAALIGVWLGSRADVWGGKRIWIISAVTFAAALVGWGLASRWEIGLAFFLVAHVCYETIFIVSETLLAQHSTRVTRSSVFGFATTVGGLATATGPTLGAWAAALSSLAAPFIIGSVSLIASLGFLARVSDGGNNDTGEILPEEFVATQVTVE